ncbi:ABC transporter ATP-binding protein [Proteiniborus sp.]|uniref:ABC transporter ATP-binding protein n=1 Tax=Proteiniborus sp. TaxID=2079015 RepID=UPI0033220C8F
MKRSLTTKTIMQVFRQHIVMSLALVFVIIAVVLLSLIPPQLLKSIIDNNLVPRNTEGLLKLALTYLGVLILIGIFDFFKGGLLTVFGQKIVNNLRKELTYKLERISTNYFSANTPGAVTSRFTNDVENVNSLFADGIISMVIDCFKIIGIVISIWMFSAKLGIVALCLVPLIYTVTRAFQKRMLAAQVKNLEQLGRVNAHISESLKNVHMIKSFSKETYMEKLYLKRLEDNFHTIERVNFYDSCYSPIIQVTRALVISLIVLLSSSQLNFLGISLGMVAASIDLISNLFSPIETLGMELQNVQKGISGVRRINDCYLEPEEPQKQSDITAEEILGENQDAGLNFEHVSFSYEAGQPILENLNLNIKNGTSVTFVGRTGVGKTTLFRLIMGLLQPTSGRILLGDIDVYEIPNSEKRRLFGYVEQQFSFIRGTVAQQISLGDESISQSQVEDVMKFVGLHDYVMNMEKGYDTEVSPNGDFSQGQKQLLAIARAIVANPSILLLDEVTANLDSVTEAQIVTVLQKAKCGRTVLSISHRMTSMLDCDTIVLLEDGQICAAGSPADILANDDWFSRQLQLEQNT